MEIERKYLIDEKNLPADLESCRSVLIEQGYLCRKPVVRIRRQDDDYILTYKSGGLMAREEYNLPLGAEGYAHLKEKIDGKLISKRRYLIPMENGLTIELDVFYEPAKACFLPKSNSRTKQVPILSVRPPGSGKMSHLTGVTTTAI